MSDIREVLLSSLWSEQRNALLALTVRPVTEDVLWILDEERLSESISSTMLVEMLKRSDNGQFATLLSDKSIGERVVSGKQICRHCEAKFAYKNGCVKEKGNKKRRQFCFPLRPGKSK